MQIESLINDLNRYISSAEATYLKRGLKILPQSQSTQGTAQAQTNVVTIGTTQHVISRWLDYTYLIFKMWIATTYQRSYTPIYCRMPFVLERMQRRCILVQRPTMASMCSSSSCYSSNKTTYPPCTTTNLLIRAASLIMKSNIFQHRNCNFRQL